MKLKFPLAFIGAFLCLTQVLIATPTTYADSSIESLAADSSSTHLCPKDNPYHLLVNKIHGLSRDFVPDQLVIPNVPFSFNGYHEKKHLEPATASALESLFKEATTNGMVLRAVSGYRSYDRQASIYNSYVSRDGVAKADTYSARPGHSEHQTGLAMDVSTPSIGNTLSASLGQTKEGIWLRENAHTYGFIIRYPLGKESITGYTYEPWHLRYVGTELATALHTAGLTMEEMDSCCTLDEPLPPVELIPLIPAVPVYVPPSPAVEIHGPIFINKSNSKNKASLTSEPSFIIKQT